MLFAVLRCLVVTLGDVTKLTATHDMAVHAVQYSTCAAVQVLVQVKSDKQVVNKL